MFGYFRISLKKRLEHNRGVVVSKVFMGDDFEEIKNESLKKIL